jgi:hypothetical protein
MIATAEQFCDPCSDFNCVGDVCANGPSRKIAGSGLLGASLVTTLIGAPVLAVGTLAEPLDVGPRDSDVTLLAGIGLTTFGAAATAGGALAGLADRRSRYPGASVSAALVGTTAMLVGMPLWAGGTRRVMNPSSTGVRWVRQNRGMMIGGITLSVLGAAMVGAGGIVSSFGGDDDGIRALSGTLAFGGLGMVIAGIPLWYVGEQRVPVDPWEAVASRMPPAYAVGSAEQERTPRSVQAEPQAPPPRARLRTELHVGPTSVAMRLSF